MHLVGFIVSIYHDARSSECQIREKKVFQRACQKEGRTCIIGNLYEFGMNIMLLCVLPNNHHLESHVFLPSATEFSLGIWF